MAEMPDDAGYREITNAIAYFAAHPPDKLTMAAVAGFGSDQLEHVFKHWTGVSLQCFVEYLSLDRIKRTLNQSHDVLKTARSNPLVRCETLTPGEIKAQGDDWVVRWGEHASPFGSVLAATIDRGCCWLGFILDDRAAAVARLAEQWPRARLIEDSPATQPAVDLAFGWNKPTPPLSLVLRGTPFQIKVWEALLRIPAGALVSYQDIASAIGHPSAVRAVGSAVGSNPISLLIPCHRVILKSGLPHNYEWGVERKRALLAWELARAATATDYNPSTSAMV